MSAAAVVQAACCCKTGKLCSSWMTYRFGIDTAGCPVGAGWIAEPEWTEEGCTALFLGTQGYHCAPTLLSGVARGAWSAKENYIYEITGYFNTGGTITLGRTSGAGMYWYGLEGSATETDVGVFNATLNITPNEGAISFENELYEAYCRATSGVKNVTGGGLVPCSWPWNGESLPYEYAGTWGYGEMLVHVEGPLVNGVTGETVGTASGDITVDCTGEEGNGFGESTFETAWSWGHVHGSCTLTFGIPVASNVTMAVTGSRPCESDAYVLFLMQKVYEPEVGAEIEITVPWCIFPYWCSGAAMGDSRDLGEVPPGLYTLSLLCFVGAYPSDAQGSVSFTVDVEPL